MNTRRVVLWVPNLFFATRIMAAARALGVETEAPPRARFVESCRARRPDLVVIDLAAPDNPLELVRALKSDASLAAIPVVGFYPHVEGALRQAALAAEVDQVLPRSAFTARLGEILAGEGRTPS